MVLKSCENLNFICPQTKTLSYRDLEKPNTAVYSASAHTSIINHIDGVGGVNVGKGAAELATCSRDGCVKIWDVRQKDRPVAILEPEEGQTRRDCWTVAFGIHCSFC